MNSLGAGGSWTGAAPVAIMIAVAAAKGVALPEELAGQVVDAFEKMPPEDELYDLAELFKIFGDSTRIRILFVLFEAEVCVCDLAEALKMTQSAISHQLAILRNARLVKARRDGKQVFYSLADDHVKTILAQGMEHIEE